MRVRKVGFFGRFLFKRFCFCLKVFAQEGPRSLFFEDIG